CEYAVGLGDLHDSADHAGPALARGRQGKGPARAGPFSVLLSFELPRLAACRAPARAGLARRRRAAGGAAALGGSALLRRAPLLRGAALGGASLPRSGLTLAGPRGLPGCRLALAGGPLAASTARGLHLRDAFLFGLLLFDLGLLAQQGLHLRLLDVHLPWELHFFDA